jgi:hypothetical protein
MATAMAAATTATSVAAAMVTAMMAMATPTAMATATAATTVVVVVTKIMVMTGMVGGTVNNQLKAAAKETTVAATAMAAHFIFCNEKAGISAFNVFDALE